LCVPAACFVGSLLLGAAASPLATLKQRQSTVPFGTPIFACTRPGVVALTFDDGPYIYTPQVLDALAAAGMRATFFLNGQNWGSISDHTGTVQRILNDGHQIGSHTWSHPNLADLSNAQVTTEMTRLEDALLGIIGRFPTYMRAPYFSTNANTLQVLRDLGYHYIHANIDTLDWVNNTPQTNENSVNIFRDGLNAGGSIVLAHDVHQTTATLLVNRMIEIIRQRGLQAVTVGECLGDPAANWYRTSRTGTPPPDPPPGGNPSPDGTCGGANAYTCPTGQCCSQWGWCGTTAEYCGAGCQRPFGVCP
jgi:peptidoglycan/xylan/chitin deacetylase (PgdA/CDA1 family)